MRKDFRRTRSNEPRINQRIRAREVRLIDKDGGQVGVVPIQRALFLAREDGLDVVEVQANVSPPVCKILDYGRYKYELRKKSKESKRKQHIVLEKHVRFRVNTGPHDLETKIRHARGFLEAGHRVIFSIRLRGREHEHKTEARHHFEKCKKALSDVSKVEMDVRQDGSSMLMVLISLPPSKRKKKAVPAAKKPAPAPAAKKVAEKKGEA